MAAEVKKCSAKVIILGETGAGKSSLFYRFKHMQFKERCATSTDGGSALSRGFDSCTRNIVLSPDRQVNMSILDSIVPNDRLQSIGARFYNRVQAVLLVCSLDEEHTLLRLPQWADEARQHIKDHKTCYVVVGTKCDLPDRERDIPSETLKAFGDFHNLTVCEVSSKTGEGVNELLRLIAHKVTEQHSRVQTGRISAGSGRGETSPLLTDESCDRDGFIATKGASQQPVCPCCVIL